MIIENNSLGRTINIMDLIAERHKALSCNLANMHTPNYKRKDVSFSQYLGGCANPLETKLASKLGPSPVTVENTNEEVNAAKELSEIQKNSILYIMAVRRMTTLISEMKTVINMGNT